MRALLPATLLLLTALAPAASAGGGLWDLETCDDPADGNRVYVDGMLVRDCGDAVMPVTVDLECAGAANGVRLYVAGIPVTRCIPLPHGV